MSTQGDLRSQAREMHEQHTSNKKILPNGNTCTVQSNKRGDKRVSNSTQHNNSAQHNN